jgi:cyanophycinase
MGEKVKGFLAIIGGAEDKSGECKILKNLVKMIGGNNAKLSILTTATENPAAVGDVYSKVFGGLGINNIKILNINTREDANQQNNIDLLEDSTGIFFTGGDQLRITSILGGTKLSDALHKLYSQGVVIIGTSAGASVMSNTMIVSGNDNDPARKCTLKMAPGLGLIEEVIIDQHFAQRGRIGRLLCGVAENPSILGIGIDEDTAIIVHPDAHFEVIGTNSVTIADGKSISASNVSELSPDEILAISDITLHLLPASYGFDMKNRKVLRLM